MGFKGIRAHQEKYDGSGYPQGLAGEEIPFEARILTTVDAYSAMTEDRPYRSALRPEDAVEELLRCSGKDFDPHIVRAFIAVLNDLGEISD